MSTESSYSAVPDTGPNIDATVTHHDGAGALAVAVPPGARSITLVVHEGTATLQISADPVAELPPGSYTFGVDRGGLDGEQLADTFNVSGGVGDVFTVISTREV